MELGGRVRYSVKAQHTGHNLLIETDTYLSLFRSHKLGKFLGGDSTPKLGGRGGARGSKMVPFENEMSVSY